MSTLHPSARAGARHAARRVAIAVVIGILATACAGSGEAEEVPPSFEEALGPEADDRTPESDDRTQEANDRTQEANDRTQEASVETEVQYGQAGGIAGRMEQLRIGPDGSGELTSRGREPVAISLDDQELAALAAALEEADLADQAPEQMSDPAIPDAFTFELSYDGATVLTDEFAAPDELRPALDLLRSIVDEARANAS